MLSSSSLAPNSTVVSSGSTGTPGIRKAGKKAEAAADNRGGKIFDPKRMLSDLERSQPTSSETDTIEETEGTEKEETATGIVRTTGTESETTVDGTGTTETEVRTATVTETGKETESGSESTTASASRRRRRNPSETPERWRTRATDVMAM
jgi:hypothetical protein